MTNPSGILERKDPCTGRRPSAQRSAWWLILLFLFPACSAKVSGRAATVYQEAEKLQPGRYLLSFHLDGKGTLSDYLRREKGRNAALAAFELPELMRLFRNAYPQLYIPVQPGVPLCHLETNFAHCKGVELLIDLDVYSDQTVLLHSWVFYHIRLLIEADKPNFFQSVKAQRDRGEFALPRHFYVGELVDAIQNGLPILREIATDYRKYIKGDDQQIEIELTLEAAPEKAAAKQEKQQIRDGADLGGGVLLSTLPNLPFFASLTVSALYSGGKTFWEVLKDGQDFELCKRNLSLDEVEFSYLDSMKRNFKHILISAKEPHSPVLIREIKIRLRKKEERELPDQQLVLPPGLPTEGLD